MSFAETLHRLRHRRGVRQFVKFVIVGASSTIIDLGLHALLYKVIDGKLNKVINDFCASHFAFFQDSRTDAAFIVWKAVTFVTATFNSFHWNRHWTFQAVDKEEAHKQLIKSYLVYIVGLLINTSVASAIYHRGSGKWIYVLSLAIATVVTTAWTFPANKFWTFRVPRAKRLESS